MENVHRYEVDLKWESGRKGQISSPVLHSTMEVATPPEFPRGIPGLWSPEHLLVAAVNSCLMTSFLAVAENSGFPFVAFESKATGKLEKVDGKYMISEISVAPVLTIIDPDDQDRARKLLEKAEALCLISHSVRSKILYRPEILAVGQ